MKRPGVYQISNTETGERYIGSSINVAARWSKHKCDLRKGRHTNPNMQQAWDRFGEDCFRVEILLEVDTPMKLITEEQRFLDDFLPEYNRSPSAGSNLGMKHTQQSKENIGRSVAGEKNAWFGKVPPVAGMSARIDVREKISKALTGRGNPMFGVRGPMSKLSDDAVREIKGALLEGSSSQSLADKFGVSKGAIQHIKKGRSYRDVTL